MITSPFILFKPFLLPLLFFLLLLGHLRPLPSAPTADKRRHLRRRGDAREEKNKGALVGHLRPLPPPLQRTSVGTYHRRGRREKKFREDPGLAPSAGKGSRNLREELWCWRPCAGILSQESSEDQVFKRRLAPAPRLCCTCCFPHPRGIRARSLKPHPPAVLF